MNPFIQQTWLESYYSSSKRMALALKKPVNVDMPLNKETKKETFQKSRLITQVFKL